MAAQCHPPGPVSVSLLSRSVSACKLRDEACFILYEFWQDATAWRRLEPFLVWVWGLWVGGSFLRGCPRTPPAPCPYAAHPAAAASQRIPWAACRGEHRGKGCGERGGMCWGPAAPGHTQASQPLFCSHLQSSCSKTFQRSIISLLESPELLTTMLFPGEGCGGLGAVSWGLTLFPLSLPCRALSLLGQSQGLCPGLQLSGAEAGQRSGTTHVPHGADANLAVRGEEPGGFGGT